MLCIVDTPDGKRAVGIGACAACGWRGVDQFDVGLEHVGPDVLAAHGELYDHDEPEDCACPKCGLHECRVDLDAAHVAQFVGKFRAE